MQVEGDGDSGGGGGVRGVVVVVEVEVGDVEGSVGKAVAERESDGAVDGFVESVANVDILAVQDAAAFGAEIQIGRIVLVADGE